MAVTAATPIADAKVLCGDPSGLSYTSAKLLPCLNKAYRDLQLRMKAAGMQSLKEISASTTVTAGTVRLGDGAGLPTDFLYPIKLWERGSTSEKWAEMKERSWEPNLDQTSTLRYWVWREDEIKFVGSTATRLVLIQYIKSQITIDETTDAIVIVDALSYLASRTAAIAALVIGGNPTRADALNADAEQAWEEFATIQSKFAQRLPARRRTNRYRQ